jgi:hypothetical protein
MVRPRTLRGNWSKKAKSAAMATPGVDIGMNMFRLIGLDKGGAIVCASGCRGLRLANQPSLRQLLDQGPGSLSNRVYRDPL